MTRAEMLAQVVAPMPSGIGRDIVRQTLKAWPDADVAEWHRMKDNERKQAKRDASKTADVRSADKQETGQVPVLASGADRTSSGLSTNGQPDIGGLSPFPPPQVSPTPPSFPAPASPLLISPGEAGKGARAKVAPQLATATEPPMPDALAVVAGLPEAWADFVASRRALRKPLTVGAARLHFSTLAEHPGRAVALLTAAVKSGWQGLEWEWLERQNPTQPRPHANHRTLTPRPALVPGGDW